MFFTTLELDKTELSLEHGYSAISIDKSPTGSKKVFEISACQGSFFKIYDILSVKTLETWSHSKNLFYETYTTGRGFCEQQHQYTRVAKNKTDKVHLEVNLNGNTALN